jgi:transglutaminase-like putative cysteine protease
VASVSAKGIPARVEAALLALSTVVGVGLGRLTTASTGWRTVLPVVCCTVAGHMTLVALQRRPRRFAAPAVGVAAVVLVCAWWFEGGTTLGGLPTPATVRGLAHLLGRAAHQITSGPTPLRAVPSVVLCVAAGAGCTAVLARWLAWPSPGAGVSIVGALLPPTGLFCYTALLSSGVGRVWGAASFITGVAVFVRVADRTRQPSSAAGGRGALLRNAAMVTAALALPLAVSPALGGMRLDALPFSKPGPPVDAFGTADAVVPWRKAPAAMLPPGTPPAALDAPSLSELSLVDDLHSVIIGRQGQLLFTADTPVATYWQVATLTRFDGQRWRADPATAAISRHGAKRGAATLPTLPQPPPEPLFSAAVSLLGLRTTLLPVPPGTQAVAGGAPVHLLAEVGAVTPKPSAPGLSYVAVAPRPDAATSRSASPTSGSSGRLPPAGSMPAPSLLAPYLALPAVDRAVVVLAHHIVRGAAGPRAEALALAGWFWSGRFHYSLTPPARGGDPLAAFLFHTRTGFCQQFAGAYAVLARLDGLPTRLAVGFTAGHRSSDGRYLVGGGDAHVWPEVYLGPATGWVSVEPTPAAGDGVVTPSVLRGTPPPRQAGQGGTQDVIRHGSVAAWAPLASLLGQPVPTTPVPPLVVAHGGTGTLPGARPWVIGVVAAVLLAVLTRRRWLDVAGDAASHLRSPRRAVLASWRQAGRELDHRHLGRFAHETMAEHAARLRAGSPGVGRPYAALAALAERACYSSELLSPSQARVARQLRARVCASARRHRRRARRRHPPGRPQPSAITRRSPASSSARARSAP